MHLLNWNQCYNSLIPMKLCDSDPYLVGHCHNSASQTYNNYLCYYYMNVEKNANSSVLWIAMGQGTHFTATLLADS